MLARLLSPRTIVARDDTGVRRLEGLPEEVRVLHGELPEHLDLVENGLHFRADAGGGQKTGWFYDQRDNRAFAARFAGGQDVLDVYSYCGGFALTAASRGARSVTAVDGSAAALAQAESSAALQKVTERTKFVRADAFEFLQAQAAEKRRYGLVIADPPAFVKARKDLKPGLKGYEKLAMLAAGVTAEPGYLCLGCCSYHVGLDDYRAATWAGIRAAGRGGRLLLTAGAGPDHPVHPALPETAYLKFLVYALD
ncbi:MAG: class I SAM-dependent methyltransferase [Geminicoccaceae bacterium]